MENNIDYTEYMSNIVSELENLNMNLEKINLSLGYLKESIKRIH